MPQKGSTPNYSSSAMEAVAERASSIMLSRTVKTNYFKGKFWEIKTSCEKLKYRRSKCQTLSGKRKCFL